MSNIVRSPLALTLTEADRISRRAVIAAVVCAAFTLLLATAGVASAQAQQQAMPVIGFVTTTVQHSGRSWTTFARDLRNMDILRAKITGSRFRRPILKVSASLYCIGS
jgi:hypothetical protein